MTDFSPLQNEPNGTKIITQYEMHACEDVGLVKFDILGIRNLAILGAVRDIVERTRSIKIDFRSHNKHFISCIYRICNSFSYCYQLPAEEDAVGEGNDELPAVVVA